MLIVLTCCITFSFIVPCDICNIDIKIEIIISKYTGDSYIIINRHVAGLEIRQGLVGYYTNKHTVAVSRWICF